MNYKEELLNLASPELKRFNERIYHTNLPVMGVKIPDLRQLAKCIVSAGQAEAYLREAALDTVEERMLYGFVIGADRCGWETFTKRFASFLPLAENWAVCDCCVSSFRAIGRDKEAFLPILDELLRSEEEMICRVGAVILLDYYLEEAYLGMIFERAVRIPAGRYYVDMAVAWLLSVCYVKYRRETAAFLEHCALSDFTYNKTLQKITESNRVTKEEKEKIRSMKRK